MSTPPFKAETVNVLVVDDHDLIRKSISRVLKKMRFALIFDSSNGVEARAAFTEHPIELVISDLYMGKADGFQLLTHIRNSDTRSDVPFIVITGEASKEDIVKASDLGADDYILKPFQPEDLEKKIVSAMAKYYKPTPLLALVRHAEHLFGEKKLEEALKAIESALQSEPNSARGNHLKALILAKSGKINQAIELLKSNTKTNPSFYKSYASLADVYLKTNKPGDAIRAMVDELNLNPKQPARQTELAKLYMSQGNLDEAIGHFRIALREDGKLQKALYGMGMAYAAADNAEKAIYYFKRLRRNHPKVTKALEAIVKVAMDAKEPRLAELMLREEKKAFPDRHDTYFVLARLLMATERPDDALAVLGDLIKRAPDNLEALQLKAMTHMRLNQLDEGITALRLVLKKEESAVTFLHLGDALLKKGLFVESIETLHKALKYKTNLPQIMFRLADGYVQTGQFLKGWNIYRRLKRMGVADPALLEAEKKAHQLAVDRRRPRSSAA